MPASVGKKHIIKIPNKVSLEDECNGVDTNESRKQKLPSLEI